MEESSQLAAGFFNSRSALGPEGFKRSCRRMKKHDNFIWICAAVIDRWVVLLCPAPGRTEGRAGVRCFLTTARRALVAGSPRPKADDPWKHPKGWTVRTAAAVFGGAPRSSFEF